ncbi:MAG: 4-(cytidine 5'-diphospho)-2-C-methyl-D-erythritol kinase [Firmicutes bacterium]|jgi:4-diphosphocytidyl-2-C-methyl-D-erythritol kinase|nr:4-(cytidine 5'-diphospho)-2-C-methyl-D-erythritol kinase [Bacillota bacterium]NLL87331.1 4-(cytidine 5'-diphospho)-2-C-methyl-D-erythritol kinase [Bacillota bacterium]HKM17521.1 4-(cytidine 5'-diphospho)-2-C-methyl-D-erythritol kinase [Limnochordia bacterium]
MQSIVVKAHGKINLSLDILDRYSNGYHQIRSVMQSIALADKLTVSKTAAGIDLQVNISSIPAQENLAYKAAQRFFEAASLTQGARIILEKNLPIAAGLAGGSANAAAVLWALNQLYGTPFCISGLQKLAVKLGADVAFCLQGGTLLAEGIGEQLTELPLVDCFEFVLAKPNPSISTKEVFQALKPSDFGDRYTSRLVQALRQGEDITRYFGNALEPISTSFVPEIGLWRERMVRAGAKASMMSGSGPTVVGVFTSRRLAAQFVAGWQDQCWMAITKPWVAGISVVKE